MSSPEPDVGYERRSSYSKFKPHRRFTNSDEYRTEKSYSSQKYSQSSRDEPRQFNSSSYQGGSPRRSYMKPMKPKFDSNYRGGGGGGERSDFKGRSNYAYNNYKPSHRNYNDNNNRRGRDDYSSSRTRNHRDTDDFDTRNPDDDPRATRTLFVGNLDTSCTANELRKIFDRFGVIEEIDVKRPSHPYGGTYAFIKFNEMDVAHKSKQAMSDQVIGRSICKIGYGKSVPSTRLWIGRLGPWVSLEELTREFDRFGAIRRIDYEKGSDCGYVLYENLDAAAVALREMKGFIFSGSPQKIQIDFASAEEKTGSDESNSYSSSNKYSRNYCPESRIQAAESARRTRDNDYPPMNAHKPDHGRMYRRNDFQDNPRGHHYDKDSSREGHERPSSKPRRKRSLSPHDYPSDSSSHHKSKHTSRRSQQDTNAKRRRSDSNDSSQLDDNGQGSNSDHLSDQEEHNKRNGNSNTEESKDSLKTDSSKTESLLDVSKRFPVAWRGTFALRNSVFPVRMHLIGGNPELADCFLRPGSAPGTGVKELSITQRLRLDQPKLEEVSRRITTAGASGHCILLALPAAQQSEDSDSGSTSQSRPLRSLVTYFKQKQAAGVIPIPAPANDNTSNSGSKDDAGVLHAFPPCDYSHQQLLKVAPNLGSEPSKEDHLVVVLVRGV